MFLLRVGWDFVGRALTGTIFLGLVTCLLR